MLMRALAIAGLLSLTSGCAWLSSFVYTIDVPQGNFIEQRDIDKLRIGMTEDQVSFVLGTPMVVNPFREGQWRYLYQLRTGHGDVIRKELVAHFDGDHKLASISGDFESPKDFNQPLTQ